jgi:ubiquinone/menaquinone biosynthesis C-methylase UbiE
MELYNKYILPKLINGLMQKGDVSLERQKYVPLAKGVVLEIGAGSGTNLPYYKSITKLYALEPSKELWKLAESRLKDVSFPVEMLTASAEHIPLPDASVDTVTSTWTMCSIPNVPLALKEMHRVLKPNGNLIFIEHGYSPDKGVARLQTILTPVWKHIAGGCHLDRKIDELIKKTGFEIKELKLEYSKSLRTAGYLYKGLATKTQ